MTTPAPEAIEYTPTATDLMEAWEIPGKRLRAAVAQTTSAIERQREARRAVTAIKAEALREAADALESQPDMKMNTTYAAVTQESVNWLRARAATIEGTSE